MCRFKLPTRESVWFSYYLILNSTWCQSLVCACVWVTRRSVGMAPRWPNCAGNMWTEALLFPPITTHLSLSYFPTLNSLFPWGEWEMASQSPSFFPLFLFASPLPSSPLAWLSSKARSFFSPASVVHLIYSQIFYLGRIFPSRQTGVTSLSSE